MYGSLGENLQPMYPLNKRRRNGAGYSPNTLHQLRKNQACVQEKWKKIMRNPDKIYPTGEERSTTDMDTLANIPHYITHNPPNTIVELRLSQAIQARKQQTNTEEQTGNILQKSPCINQIRDFVNKTRARVGGIFKKCFRGIVSHLPHGQDQGGTHQKTSSAHAPSHR